MKKNIKLVALDLDGTTLNSKMGITQRTEAAFRAAMDKGVHIVVSTGRTFHSLPKQLFTIKGLEYAVTSNGARVVELSSMKTIYENYIASHAVEEVVNVLEGKGFSLETFVEGRAYIDKAEFDQVKENGSTFRDANYILTTRNPIPGLCNYMIENKDKIENISVNFEFIEDKNKMEHILSKIPNITLTSSFAHNFEIGGASTSKAEALRFLMGRLGITSEEMLACGDSPNDLQMIKLAGIGVAMGNGRDEVKHQADIIADTCDNDGVAKIIEEYVL